MIYLAASYSRHPEMRQIRYELNKRGLDVTSRWIEGQHEALEGQSHTLNRRFATEDWEDLYRAAVVIWFADDGQTKRGRGGRHVEFGLALAWRIPVIVVGRRENVFHWLPQVTHVETVEEAYRLVMTYARTKAVQEGR